jgi:hypothetical protein
MRFSISTNYEILYLVLVMNFTTNSFFYLYDKMSPLNLLNFSTFLNCSFNLGLIKSHHLIVHKLENILRFSQSFKHKWLKNLLQTPLWWYFFQKYKIFFKGQCWFLNKRQNQSIYSQNHKISVFSNLEIFH